MSIRYLKIALVALLGLQGLLWVAGNVANWDAGVATVAYVLGMQEHAAYGAHIIPPVTNTALVTLAFVIILIGEFSVGALALKGAWDLWTARSDSAQVFNAAKTYAILGAGLAIIVWFGGFMVIGGALFQMWQTQIGAGSFADAFKLAAMGGLILLFVSRSDV